MLKQVVKIFCVTIKLYFLSHQIDHRIQQIASPSKVGRYTVAPLTFPVQEVSTSRNDITIEMHMHDGTEVGHYMGDNMK